MGKNDKARFSLYRRASGVYYVRLWDSEARSYTPGKSTGTKDLKLAAARAQKMLEAGQLVKRERDPLFIDELVHYFEGRGDICAAYRRDILGRIKKHAMASPHLQAVRMSQIKHSHINRMIEDLRLNVTISGINNLTKNIRTFIKWANSLDYLSIDFSSKITILKRERAVRGHLEPEEMAHLSKTPWHDPRIRAAVAMGMYAGMRWGEARALRWGDVNFDDNTIDICRNYVDEHDAAGNPVFKTPKAGSARKWPYMVIVELRDTLLDLYRVTPCRGPDDLVLCNVWLSRHRLDLDPGRPILYHSIQRQLRKYFEAAGISVEEQKRRRLTYHSLRHSFASFVATVTPAAGAMGLTGHSDVSVFEGYRHNLQRESHDALTAANEAFERYRDDDKTVN
jgi:integrase